jgi:hypothetical protein
MLIPALGSENTVVKTDATGKIQGENKDGETLLSFIREVRQILENPAIQRMITQKIPQNQNQEQTEQKQEQTKQKPQGFDESAIIEMLSTTEGCIKFANGLQTVIDTFGDKKLSEFKEMILKQSGAEIQEKPKDEKPEFKEVVENETQSN